VIGSRGRVKNQFDPESSFQNRLKRINGNWNAQGDGAAHPNGSKVPPGKKAALQQRRAQHLDEQVSANIASSNDRDRNFIHYYVLKQ